ncbi:MAG: bifunctional riboflavin kinase/FAD synthetase [Actinomycetia bacterium]|nr:bifunctional riboflavin kinase/FAD synthetase [Actinomycetes bacterium]MCP5035472.1 bifunctional riboflavin kinase/FAD synthetase [Actinomycetes bacterium]
MEIHHDLERCGDQAVNHALTIGFYDGVHLGHQAVIQATQRRAEQLGVKMAVVTFDPHPAYVLRPESAPKLLTNLDQKLDLLDQCGVETVVVVPFDTERASETAEEFVEAVILGCLKAKAVVVGSDFHFGKGRTGNVDLLTRLGQDHGFEVEGIELLPRPNGVRESVSSTSIRRALAGGDVVTAARLLGRNHEIRGPVVQGDQRGRTIGFPTANVAVAPELAMPADAVYAGWYYRPDGTRWPSAINIGKRPTFYLNADHSLLEAHLIGYEGDLYGEVARVQLVELLRSEQRFDGIEALTVQLGRDIAQATEVLERYR